jgi:hypothetical protein
MGEFLDWLSDLVSQEGLCPMELIIMIENNMKKERMWYSYHISNPFVFNNCAMKGC